MVISNSKWTHVFCRGVYKWLHVQTAPTSCVLAVISNSKWTHVFFVGECVTNCEGKVDATYQSCSGCDVYAECNNGVLDDNKPCPENTYWDDTQRACQAQSATCRVIPGIISDFSSTIFSLYWDLIHEMSQILAQTWLRFVSYQIFLSSWNSWKEYCTGFQKDDHSKRSLPKMIGPMAAYLLFQKHTLIHWNTNSNKW